LILKKNIEIKKGNDVILFEDECSISNTATTSYSWSKKGFQPVVKLKQVKRERQTFFGCVDTETGIVLSKRADNGNATTFKQFLKMVLKQYVGRKIYMILDNVRYHHAKKLKPFLENNKDKLELVFLPPYSPDFNPMERVWWYMRKKITHNRYTNCFYERVKKFWMLFSHFLKPNDLIIKLCKINYSV